MVQSRLLKGLSDPLDARIPSEENDSRWQTPVSEIEDVEWGIFVGLVEFAYTGDYAAGLSAAQSKLEIGGEGDKQGTEDGEQLIQTKQPRNARPATKKPIVQEPAVGAPAIGYMPEQEPSSDEDLEPFGGFGSSKRIKTKTVYKNIVRFQPMG